MQIKTSKKWLIISIGLNFILAYFVGYFYYQQDLIKSKYYYDYVIIPHMELYNKLNYSYKDNYFSGELSGFVKFEDIVKQPENFWQYDVIRATNKRDSNKNQIFVIDEYLKTSSLPPTKLGSTEIYISNITPNSITLTDTVGNKFLIDKGNGEKGSIGVMLYDAQGDEASLITDNFSYTDFVKKIKNP